VFLGAQPCEWAPGLGWRSHREATPGGRPGSPLKILVGCSGGDREWPGVLCERPVAVAGGGEAQGEQAAEVEGGGPGVQPGVVFGCAAGGGVGWGGGGGGGGGGGRRAGGWPVRRGAAAAGIRPARPGLRRRGGRRPAGRGRGGRSGLARPGRWCSARVAGSRGIVS